MDNVAFLDAVILAFEPPFAGFFGTRFTVVTDEVVVSDNFGADEATFKVGVNDACSLRCSGVSGHGPGTDFFDAGSEVGTEAEQVVAGADDAIQTGFGQTVTGK